MSCTSLLYHIMKSTYQRPSERVKNGNDSISVMNGTSYRERQKSKARDRHDRTNKEVAKSVEQYRKGMQSGGLFLCDKMNEFGDYCTKT